MKDTQDISANIQIKNISRIKIFMKTAFFHYTDPFIESSNQIKKIRRQLKSHPLAKKYIAKNLTFSKEFLKTIVFIHHYMQAFREKLAMNHIFQTTDFPLWLLNHFSSEQQKKMYTTLTDAESIKKSIAQNGLYQTKMNIKNTFHQYKESFSRDQRYNIHNIIDLGAGMYNFLQYDLTSFIVMLYPSYMKDKQLIHIDQQYKGISIHYLAEELEIFLSYLTAIQMNKNYYQFIFLYGQFLGQKIINKKEFDAFYSYINELLDKDMILKILQVEEKSSILYNTPRKIDIEKPTIVHVMKELSQTTQKQHTQAIKLFITEVEESTLNYMFDKQTIQQIKFQQKKVDSVLETPVGKKSSISVSIVILAFSEKIFYKNIQPSLDFLIKNTVFLLPEFKKDLITYFESLISNFGNIQNNITSAREIMKTPYGNLRPIDIRTKQTCQDILSNIEMLDSLLKVIISTGEEELKHNVQLVVPKDTMENLMKNISISRKLMQKTYQYIQSCFQTSDII